MSQSTGENAELIVSFQQVWGFISAKPLEKQSAEKGDKTSVNE